MFILKIYFTALFAISLLAVFSATLIVKANFLNKENEVYLIFEVEKKYMSHIRDLIAVYKQTQEFNMDFMTEILNIKSCSIDFKK